jgi:hypothetical protein
MSRLKNVFDGGVGFDAYSEATSDCAEVHNLCIRCNRQWKDTCEHQEVHSAMPALVGDPSTRFGSDGELPGFGQCV